MAGPGGGPSRRSHTKSRKGCKTCKRRHIRCDETFPQCRNCTKHQVRCDYMDSPTLTSPESPQSPRQPNLLWTSEIDATVEHWKQTGEFPFPELRVFPQPPWHSYSKNDLRLIHHLSSITNEMYRNRTSKMPIWTANMPKFLGLGASHPFVMHSILAFSASHLAYISQSTETRNLAGHYGGVALKGLHEAIANFSKINSDAVFASALLLQWQANDWRGWASLVTSTVTIINVMQPWKHESLFTDLLAEYSVDSQTYKNPVSSLVTQEVRREQLSSLQHVHDSLQRLQPYLARYDQESKWLDQLRSYIERLRTSNAPQSPEEQFNQLYALRKWLFWIPVSLLGARRGDVMVLMVLAYFYATAIALEPIFSDVGGVLCANFALPPLEEIIRVIDTIQTTQGYSPTTQTAMICMDFARETSESHRSRKDWSKQRPDDIPSIQHTPYSLNTINLDPENHIPHYTYGGTGQSLSPAFAPSPLSFISNPLGSGQTSPYLEVPRSSIDGFGGFSTSFISPSTSPSVPSLASPLASPYPAPEENGFSFGAPIGCPGGFVLTPAVWT